MLVIPLGHEQTTVRRLPWVTFSIMALCVAAYLLTLLTPSSAGKIVERERFALKYYFEHPYLEFDDRLKGYQFYALGQAYPSPPPAPSDPSLVGAEQQELDRLATRVFAAVDEQPYYRWGLVPSRVRALTVLSHMFMHGGLLHLLGNLFILYLAGPFIEDLWGRPLYAGFYLSGGIFAGLAFALRYPHLDEPLIGASGAIAAVMGAFALRCFNTKINFFYFFFFFKVYSGTFQAPAWLMLGLWFLRELASSAGVWGTTSLADAGNIAYLAHVAGFGFGLVVAFAMSLFRVEERFIHPAIEARLTVFENLAVERAVELARTGQGGEAMRRLQARLAEEPEDPDAAAALWGVALAEGAVAEAAPSLLPVLRRAARDGDADLVGVYLPEALHRVPDLRVDLALLVRCAELLRGKGALGEAAEMVEWANKRLPDSPPAALLVRLARLGSELHLSSATTFAHRARHAQDVSQAALAELDRLGLEPGPPAVPEPRRALGGSGGRRDPLKVVEAVPLGLSPEALDLDVSGTRRRLPLAQVRAVGAATVEGPNQAPRVVVDLLLDLPGEAPSSLRVVRLVPGFDPRALVGGGDPRQAMHELLARLVELSGSHGLPDGKLLIGQSLPTYSSVEEYERDLFG